ncbi:MAG: Holliday junction branch migration protein RuvA [Candidatus Dadabacteria bacterium]|nr:Holliday junction branch migration protein RuvA [Candidatus Dadabacteria bacterium]NIS07446.1 Holliday junction branch migration protein RuvA [Candidatus Dadabacteria bacterium]NIY21098.1 Holliday junction branch migration protein RuvA [Candidatus Dadabacteria bacterium]
MISLLKGTVARKAPEEVVVDVGGVGYGVLVPSPTYFEIPEPGGSIELHIYTHMKENTLELFGFMSPEEKEVFKTLIGVSGIGPRASINILSNISPADLIASISSGDLTKKKIPGIGPKLAARITTELKDKIKLLNIAQTAKTGDNNLDDVISVLSNLGYRQNEIEENLQSIKELINNSSSIEDVIKESLKIMKQV